MAHLSIDRHFLGFLQDIYWGPVEGQTSPCSDLRSPPREEGAAPASAPGRRRRGLAPRSRPRVSS